MPTQVQNIVLPPIQKFIPPPEKPPEDTAPRRGEEFGAALKAARTKSAQPDKTDAAKARAKDSKTESKKDSDGKTADKASAKRSGKNRQTNQATQTGKSKSAKSGNTSDVDEADANPDAEEADSAAADQSAQSATADQAEAANTAPQSKAATQAKDDPEQSNPDEKKTAANDSSAGAQVVQPIDRGKDQNQHRKNPDDQNAADEGDSTISAVDAQDAAASTGKIAANGPNQSAAADGTTATSADTSTAAAQAKAQHTATVSPINLNDDAEVAVKPSRAANDKAPPPADASAPVDPATQFAQLSDAPDAQTSDPKTAKVSLDLDPIARAVLESQGGTSPQTGNVTAPKAANAPPPPPPEVQFAQSNHDRIVTSVQSQLLPHGGSMEIRLDPPELGALRVMVEMRDGIMSATFQTSNEEATQLLSHSLNQLKHVLESQGVSVERLQVQQAPKGEHSSAKDDSQQQQRGTADDHAARQEQQRKEMMRRMWRRVSGAGDPIDYLA